MATTYLPTGKAHRILVHDDAEPEQRLWAVVLACAVTDGLVGAWCAGEDQERDQAACAQDWMRCRCAGKCFELVCAWAGLEPDVVRERASG